MKRLDRDALRKAMRLAREDPLRDQQLIAKLQDEPWEDVARFAAYCMQCETLNLRPWQRPPMHMTDVEPVDDPQQRGLREAWELRRRLIGAGLSRWEPDPLGALAALAATTAA